MCIRDRHTEDRFRYDSATQTATREAHVNVGGSLTWVPYILSLIHISEPTRPY